MYEDDVIATSFGNYVCLPLMRKAGTDLTKAEAKKVMEDCLRVLYYRNTKSSARVSLLSQNSPLSQTPRPLFRSLFFLSPSQLHAMYSFGSIRLCFIPVETPACGLCCGAFSADVCVVSQIQISTVTAAGVEIEEPYEVSTHWGFEGFRHTEYHGQKRPQETFVGR